MLGGGAIGRLRWRRTTGVWQWLASLALLLSLGTASLSPISSAPALGQAATGATLSVLATPVEVSSRGAAFGPARDGMAVGPGDQIRTLGGGVALLTFFDGSETQLTPNSQVQIQQANSSGGAQISLTQVLGTSVDRVQRLTAQPTNFSTDTPAATAVVRGTRFTVTTRCYTSPPALPLAAC